MGDLRGLIEAAWWKLRRWYLRQMVDEASTMTRAHWNIAHNDLDDHERRKPATLRGAGQ